MPAHRFGGLWTDRKLVALREYLTQYRQIFTKNAKARFFRTIYVDGFAGTGERVDSQTRAQKAAREGGLFFHDLNESPEKKSGSARIALELASPFDAYLFVDKRKTQAAKLSALVDQEFPALVDRCRIEVGDANSVLTDWCAATNWRQHRAVVFLDPYGMSVNWTTIEAIALTQAIDMWILFPLGTGMNRLLTKGEKPPPEWSAKLDQMLGTKSWREAFYQERRVASLFTDNETETVKVATFGSQAKFFLDRLRSVFAAVSPHALPLYNSKGNPMYLLCFAAGNPRGAGLAVKIANHLLQA